MTENTGHYLGISYFQMEIFKNNWLTVAQRVWILSSTQYQHTVRVKAAGMSRQDLEFHKSTSGFLSNSSLLSRTT